MENGNHKIHTSMVSGRYIVHILHICSKLKYKKKWKNKPKFLINKNANQTSQRVGEEVQKDRTFYSTQTFLEVSRISILIVKSEVVIGGWEK